MRLSSAGLALVLLMQSLAALCSFGCIQSGAGNPHRCCPSQATAALVNGCCRLSVLGDPAESAPQQSTRPDAADSSLMVGQGTSCRALVAIVGIVPQTVVIASPLLVLRT